MNYELDTYLDALKGMPDADTKLVTKNGDAYCQKIDIFKAVMWFAFPSNGANWYKIEVEQVKEILELNKQGKAIDNIEDYVFEDENQNELQSVVAEDSLSRFDQPKKKKRPQRNKKKPGTEAEVQTTDAKRTVDADRNVKRAPRPENAGPRTQTQGNKPPRNQQQRTPQNTEGKPATQHKPTPKNVVKQTIQATDKPVGQTADKVQAKPQEGDATTPNPNQQKKKNFRRPNKPNGPKPNRKPDDTKQ